MNDGGSNGTSCGGIKVSTDTTKLSNIFGGSRNLVGKDEDEARVASSRVVGAKVFFVN